MLSEAHGGSQRPSEVFGCSPQGLGLQKSWAPFCAIFCCGRKPAFRRGSRSRRPPNRLETAGGSGRTPVSTASLSSVRFWEAPELSEVLGASRRPWEALGSLRGSEAIGGLWMLYGGLWGSFSGTLGHSVRLGCSWRRQINVSGCEQCVVQGRNDRKKKQDGLNSRRCCCAHAVIV